MFGGSSRWQYGVLVLAAVLLFFAGIKYGKYIAYSLQEPVVIEGEIEEGYHKSEETSSVLKVHVAGAVFEPGVYEFHEGSRVDDAVKKAVPLPEADLDRLNLAQSLRDGQKIYVFYKNAQGDLQVEVQEGIAGDKIDINSCSAKELEELPGIGPALSQRIVDYRRQNGPFSSVDDLKNVSGIGDKKLEAIRELVVAY